MFCRSLCVDTPAGSEGANLAAAESEQREVERPATQLRRMCSDVPNAPNCRRGENSTFFSPAFLLIQKLKKKAAAAAATRTSEGSRLI